MTTPAIDVRHVTKIYRRFGRSRQFATLKSAILSGTLVSELRADETFQALADVSFEVPRGCTFGIDRAERLRQEHDAEVRGGHHASRRAARSRWTAGSRRSSSSGPGSTPRSPAARTSSSTASCSGSRRSEISRRFDEIVEFAELEDFIDAPVKTYSSGMYMRLGFAVAIHVDPDVLLVDEVLAVGDAGFTHKCLDKFGEFRRRGKTILLVTHSLGLIERFCDEARVAGRRPGPRHG